jgi:hypothetical protein
MLRSESVAGDQAGVSCVNLDEVLCDQISFIHQCYQVCFRFVMVRLGDMIC